jgi:hypothetical protein
MKVRRLIECDLGRMEEQIVCGRAGQKNMVALFEDAF